MLILSRKVSLAVVAVTLAVTGAVHAQGNERTRHEGIEPGAGMWKTWVISSGRDYRVPPPPGPAETIQELSLVADLLGQNDDAARQQIAFWDAGAPTYRWIDLLNSRALQGTPTTSFPHRVYGYMALAMYDATIAAWESKYFYNRRRPSELFRRLPTVLPVPDSPSYPSEHAATAWAAATVLAHLIPAEADAFRAMAEEAGWSRVRAGLQYPSDYYAGKALGERVGMEVIEKADGDGASTAVWDGIIPTGPCKWTLTPGGPSAPGNVTAVHWKPLLLSSPSQFRPPQPPACDSAAVQADLVEIRSYSRVAPGTAASFVFRYKSFYWQSPEGLNVWPYKWADKWMFEDGLDRNPPRAARAYALIAAVMLDAFIASQDGKFAYWYLRPHQLDPTIVPSFPVPYFPSYPSNHSTFSAARSDILAYLFPTRAAFARAVGKEAGDSRIWAGIHYQMDNAAGVQLGRSVAGVFIAWAENDGSR